MPSWSRDGRFIYYASNRTGRFEVWRVAAQAGTEERLTSEGGVVPVESVDGRTLYYQPAERGALLARPTSGGGQSIPYGRRLVSSSLMMIDNSR